MTFIVDHFRSSKNSKSSETGDLQYLSSYLSICFFLMSYFFQVQIYLSNLNLFHSLHGHTSETKDDIGWHRIIQLQLPTQSLPVLKPTKLLGMLLLLRQADQRINGSTDQTFDDSMWFRRIPLCLKIDVSVSCPSRSLRSREVKRGSGEAGLRAVAIEIHRVRCWQRLFLAIWWSDVCLSVFHSGSSASLPLSWLSQLQL